MSANQSTEDSTSFATPDPPAAATNPAEIEKIEEEKLKARYNIAGGTGLGRPGGHSAFLQKRLLQKGPKYFDSGDYQMAKQNGGKSLFANKPIGEAIPTPESVPARKTSIIQQPCNKFQSSS